MERKITNEILISKKKKILHDNESKWITSLASWISNRTQTVLNLVSPRTKF